MGNGGRDSRATRIGVSWLRADAVGTDRCMRAVRASGGEPVPLLADVESWEADLRTLRGLILTGGNAIDPRLYGQENLGLCRVVIPHRDDLELEALRYCQERGLPVLGVCRGMQFLNVAYGGSMVQDLPITSVEHDAAEAASRFHDIEVLRDTLLSEITGAHTALRVNSRHHQGLTVAHLAPGLRLSAIAPDGVVEGLEASGEQFLMGVQFHPEYAEETPRVAGIFDVLVSRARRA